MRSSWSIGLTTVIDEDFDFCDYDCYDYDYDDFPFHKAKFNEKLLEYRFEYYINNRENGDLERLGRFWLHGVCKPNMQVDK